MIMRVKRLLYINQKLLLALLLCSVFSTCTLAGEIEDYWVEKYFSVSFPLKNIKINSFFGMRNHPTLKSYKHHNGIDLQAHYEEVMAMFDGVVVRTGEDNVSGKFITMRHGDYTVSYCHLSEIWVKESDRFFAGDIVGVTGNTGRTSGPHLHITSRLKGEIEDPLILLRYINDTRKEALLALRIEESKILSPRDFIAKYAGMAMRHQQEYGIPASVTLAQMCIESSFGSSELARTASNFFGIKASSYWLDQGLPYVVRNDDRPNEKFCMFDSAERSMEYHSRLLSSKRYRRCFLYKPTDFHNWLLELKAAGYATDRHYVRRCEKVIKQYKLYLYDYKAEKI